VPPECIFTVAEDPKYTYNGRRGDIIGINDLGTVGIWDSAVAYRNARGGRKKKKATQKGGRDVLDRELFD